MAHSGSRSDQRTEVAPPPEPATRTRRGGYVVLAVSGVVLATAFGGIAQLASHPAAPPAAGGTSGGNGNPGAQQAVPADSAPSIGLATTSSEVTSTSSSPTSVTRIGPDGKPTVTTLTSRGQASSTPGGTGEQHTPGGSTSQPGKTPAPSPTQSATPTPPPTTSNTPTTTPTTNSPTSSPGTNEVGAPTP